MQKGRIDSIMLHVFYYTLDYTENHHFKDYIEFEATKKYPSKCKVHIYAEGIRLSCTFRFRKR